MTKRTSSQPPTGLRRFRRRVLAVTAASLAGGIAVLAVVLAVAVPTIERVDLVVLALAVAVHAAAAATVGRRWEPGGAVNLGYVLLVLLLVLVGIQQSVAPASDAFWFLLVPVGLAAITLGTTRLVVVVGIAITGYVVASVLGPGLDVAVAAGRAGALVVFAVASGAINRRLRTALREADAAQASLRADVEEVTTQNIELHRLDSARDDYVSSVSHELRTPLTVILGMARTLDERWDELEDAARRQIASRVAASARGLEGIVSALLDLARIERGGLDPEFGPVGLADAVDEALARLAPLLDDHVVRTDVNRATIVHTDPRLLERVLDNLVTNATRHTPPGTTVLVVARVDGSRVRVEVKDDGPGIPPEDVARLGQQFFRGSAGQDRDRDGLGLGLALVVEVLRAMGEELEVASAVGKGATFAFGLPVAEHAVRG